MYVQKKNIESKYFFKLFVSTCFHGSQTIKPNLLSSFYVSFISTTFAYHLNYLNFIGCLPFVTLKFAFILSHFLLIILEFKLMVIFFYST